MRYLIVLCLTCTTLMSFAQTDEVIERPATIKGSFDSMLDASNRYQDFKVVKQTKLNAFIREVQDSLNLLESKLNQEIKLKKGLTQEVATLQNTIDNGNQEINALEGQRDNMTTLGMEVNKQSFSNAMWIALMSLLGLLIILFFRNKSIAGSQKNVKATLHDMEEELALVKKKALEREQELKREVQDYVNKLEAMGPPK